MQVFKIRQDGFKEIRKQMLLRGIPLLLIAGAVGITISTLNTEQKANDVNVLPIVIPVMAAALGIGLYRGVNRQKAIFESYRLTIADRVIRREQLNTPGVYIHFDNVKEICRNKNGSFTIKGKEKTDLIAIPAQIDDYLELEAALQQVQPIVVKEKQSLIEKYQGLAGLGTLGLMLCVYLVNNKIVVALTGSALLALLVWSFIKIRSSKNVDNKTKSGVWWVLLVVAAVIAVMVTKLTGQAHSAHP